MSISTFPEDVYEQLFSHLLSSPEDSTKDSTKEQDSPCFATLLRQVHPHWRYVIDTHVGPRLLADETGFCARRVQAMLHWLRGEGAAVPWARALCHRIYLRGLALRAVR